MFQSMPIEEAVMDAADDEDHEEMESPTCHAISSPPKASLPVCIHLFVCTAVFLTVKWNVIPLLLSNNGTQIIATQSRLVKE
jgi:hypothetical protein